MIELPLYDAFQTYEYVTIPETKLNLPLEENSLDLSDWALNISSDGTVTVKSNLPIAYIDNNSNNRVSSNIPTRNVSNLSFEELVKLEKIPIRITSGFRKNSKTASGHRSYHSMTDKSGNPVAYDVAPLEGYTFDDLRNIFYKNPNVVRWFKENGYGILEERVRDSKKGFYDLNNKFHYTGATGPHFHIGPDTHARLLYNSKITKALEGTKLEIPYTTYQPIEINDNTYLELPLVDSPINLNDFAQSISSNGSIIAKSNLPISYVDESYKSSVKLPENPNADELSYQGTKLDVINYFVSKGLKKHQAQGIVGNLMTESGLNPKATNKSSGAFGLALWLGNRKANLISLYGESPTFKLQLDFLWSELLTSEKSALDSLLSSLTVEDATRNFMNNFERPSKLEKVSTILKRINFAKS